MTQATVGFLDDNGNWVAVTADSPLPTAGAGGGAVASVNGQTGEVELTAADVNALPDSYTPPSELPINVPGDVTATGTPSATTYLRGDGSWNTPTNTTYTVITQANVENPGSTTAGTITGQRLAQGVAAYLTANPIPAELPAPPAEGTFNLQSVDGVLSWVEAAE